MDCGIIYYGMQLASGTSVQDFWRKNYPESYASRAFYYPFVDGMPNRYATYFERSSEAGHYSPHNVKADAAGVLAVGVRAAPARCIRSSSTPTAWTTARARWA